MQPLLHRRGFLAALAAGAVAPRVLGAIGSRADLHATVSPVGIQLYALLRDARADMATALGRIARAGFTEVELLDSFGNLGVAAPRMRALLDAAGLKAPSTHTTTKALDDLPRLIRDAKTLGHEYLTVVSLPVDRKTATIDDFRRWGDRLNVVAKTVRNEGMWLGFHNEPTDFAPIGGAIPYDAFVDSLDPTLVRLQLDTGNAAMGGQDPLRYMERYASRYWQFHMKDVPRIGVMGDTEIGTGVIDFKAIMARVKSTAGKHFYLEQESAGITDEGLRRSAVLLANLGA